MKEKESLATAELNEPGKLHFEEVEVRRMETVKEGDSYVTKFERIKTIRPVVKITQDQADVINAGRQDHPDNRFFVVYLLPGQELEPIIKPISK